MKKLKLDHELAQLVLAGQKTSTWRLFDDKDLTVNDEVELIDKVDPNKPQTWQVIGVANLTQVVEKRLGDITPNEAEGHEPFNSSEEMLDTFKQYYGPHVTLDTPVKIIHFAFNASKPGDKIRPPAQPDSYQYIKLYADGGSRGNPGPSSSGYVLLDKTGNIVVDKGIYLGVTTNNQAEYQALKLGLEEAQKLGAKEVEVYMDSLLVINQMKGVFKVRNRDLWPIHDDIQKLCKGFKSVHFSHVPRELNKLADAAVNRALDAALR